MSDLYCTFVVLSVVMSINSIIAQVFCYHVLYNDEWCSKFTALWKDRSLRQLKDIKDRFSTYSTVLEFLLKKVSKIVLEKID